MSDAVASASYVDEAPIDKLERRNSLEKHLQMRPDEADLKNRHILLDTTAAPALQSKAAELVSICSSGILAYEVADRATFCVGEAANHRQPQEGKQRHIP